MSSGDLEMQQDNAKKEIHELTSKLRTFRQSNERALKDLKGKQMKESKFKDEESQKYMMVSLTSLISRRNSNGDMMLRGRILRNYRTLSYPNRNPNKA
jgi:hypothetical protein